MALRVLALHTTVALALISVLTTLGSQVHAQVIDFERVLGVVPIEGITEINTQFAISHDVTFSLEVAAGEPPEYPVIAEVGCDPAAFAFVPCDTPLPNQGTGSFFLTDDGVISGNPKPLIITYGTPTAAASGAIIDIDANEEYTIEARNDSGVVLERRKIFAGDLGAGDGRATYWSFNHINADIKSIRIDADGHGGNVGLAFDNFNVSGANSCAVASSTAYTYVDFETSADGSGLNEGDPINAQFVISDRVSFSLEVAAGEPPEYPVIAEVGCDPAAFAFVPCDTPLPNQGTGSFFLTDDGVISGNPLPLLISYSVPAAAANGVILDIDAAEVYTIEALDIAGNTLELTTIQFDDPTAGNQIATPWSFYRSVDDIYSVRVSADGNGQNVGLAFDNFSACSIPPPCDGFEVFIDFESYPDGSIPMEGEEVSTQYGPDYSLATNPHVVFQLEPLVNGEFPVIAEVGCQPPFNQGGDAFAFDFCDEALPTAGVGSFFLTDDGVVVGNPSPLLISYSTRATMASGVIIDIDSNEVHTIEALDGLGVTLESITITAGDPATGDGAASPWSFYRPQGDIHAVRISAVGTQNVGLAFDNLRACLVSYQPNFAAAVPSLRIPLVSALAGVLLAVGAWVLWMERGRWNPRGSS